METFDQVCADPYLYSFALSPENNVVSVLPFSSMAKEVNSPLASLVRASLLDAKFGNAL